MSGSFDPNNPPTRRGFFNRFMAAAQQAIIGGTLGIVAIPVTGDWGPTGVMKEITSQNDWDSLFGSNDNSSRFAVLGALAGNGSSDSGASKVIAYRMPLSGQVAAVRVLSNTTPATALTLTAKYKGTRGNAFKVTVQDHPTDNTKDQLLIYDGTTLKETWSYTQTDIAGLAAQMNDAVTGSKYATAVANVTGTALATVTSQSFGTGTGGNTAGANGTAVSSDYTSAMTAFESQQFNIFAIPNTTDSTIMAAVRSWITNINDTSRRVLLVEGGAANETLSDAIARSALSSSEENIVNLGYNMFTEQATGIVRSTAEMVGYLAGIIAGVGIKGSISFQRLAGFDLTAPTSGTLPSFSDIDAATAGGVVVFSKDAFGIRIEAEVTTFTLKTDADRPYDDFSSIKGVRTMHQIENDINDITVLEWIGQVANTEAARDNYVGVVLAYLQALEGQTALQSGLSSVWLDPQHDNTQGTLWPRYRITMTKAIERVLATGELA